MKVIFLGATHEVTGSLTYLEAEGHKFLVDCGMEQGKDIFVNQDIPVKASEIEAVFLTHAHVDHSGNLPLLYKRGFRGKVYATEATTNLCRIMLLDSAGIQESEAEWQSRKNKRAGKEVYEPIFTTEDAEKVLQMFVPISYDRMVQAAENCRLRFNNVGHLLGASAVELWLTEEGETRKIIFSGDVGNLDRPLIANPGPLEGADYCVIESTYGDRFHEPHEGADAYVNQLAAILERTFARGGNVVIPSFAVGRTQELLYFLREIKEKQMVHSLPDFRVVVDSPLAVEATGVFLQTPKEYFDRETREILDRGVNPIFFEGLRVSVSSDESKAINVDPVPQVILSASGMCEAGRIRHHLKHNLWRPESTVLFVGYQTVGTLGRMLQDGATEVKLFGEEIAVRAEIATLSGISGHADQRGLIGFLEKQGKKPGIVFVNHGDPDSVENFAAVLREKGYRTEAPYSGAAYDLLTGDALVIAVGEPVPEKAGSGDKNGAGEKAGSADKNKVTGAYKSLLEALDRLTALVKSLKGHPNKELLKLEKELNNTYARFKDKD